jgi:putative acetyltransferase
MSHKDRLHLSADGGTSSVLDVIRAAFGGEEAVVVLTTNLLKDPTAAPTVSLLGSVDDVPVGHILFSRAAVTASEDISAYILAPLAVVPDAQRKGIGGCLIEAGFEHLARMNVDLVFVLGHPEYYPRHGFVPAHRFGLSAPYPIPDKNQDAWMVHHLNKAVEGQMTGQVCCAESLDHPDLWKE